MRDGNYMQIHILCYLIYGTEIFNIDKNMFFRTMEGNPEWMFIYITSCCILFLLICIIQVRKAEKG
jgi:hypothetical protein